MDEWHQIELMCARSRRKRRGSLSLISLIAAVIVLQKYGVYSYISMSSIPSTWVLSNLLEVIVLREILMGGSMGLTRRS